MRGGSTVILAMRDGRAAADVIDRALRSQPCLASIPDHRKQTPNRIVAKRWLTPEITWLEVEAPEIARHWNAGQFVIVRPTEVSERIPLTTPAMPPRNHPLVVQTVGRTSREMASLSPGDQIAVLPGPLGRPATIHNLGRVLWVAGGVGVAEVIPMARALREAGNHVTALCGARSVAHIILDAELRSAADEVFWSTDDGSGAFRGTVVDLMRERKNRHTDAPDMAR